MDAGSGQVFGYRPEDEDRRKWLAEIKQLGHLSWLPGIANGMLALVFGKALWIAAAVLGVGYFLSNSLGKRISENSQRFRQELLNTVKSGGREADVPALKTRAEAEYDSIRDRQALVPKLYAGSVALSLVLWGGFAATDWLTSDAGVSSGSYEDVASFAPAGAESGPVLEPGTLAVSDTTLSQAGNDLQVVITNNTGYPVQQVFISPDDATSWEEDLLDGRVLPNGESMRFTLQGYSNPMFDIKLVDTDGDSYSFHDVDVERYDVTATIANLDQ
jgi:hypothetical protein